MKIKYLIGGIGFLAGLSALAGTAGAQALLTEPSAIRACLCQQQALTTLSDAVQAQRRLYDERRQALQALDSQVETQRAQLASGQSTDTEGFKHLLDQRDEAEASLSNEATPRYSDSVSRYNSAVAAFNEQCAGKIYAPDVEQSLRASNFICPKP